MPELKAGVYKHYKGGLYLALGVARHSETEEKLVTYIPLAVIDKPRIVVRPYSMFFEDVFVDGRKIPRFLYIGEYPDKNTASNYDKLSGYSGEDKINN
jgi:hypothetical protein